MSHEIFLFIILLFIFGNVWQNHIKWPLRDRKHRMPYLACSMSEENTTQLFRFSKQGTDTERLRYFYELLFKNKRWECYLRVTDWMSIRRWCTLLNSMHCNGHCMGFWIHRYVISYNFYTRFYTNISSFKMSECRCVGVLTGSEFAD